MQGGSGIETLPSSILQEILDGRLGAVDLARLESCSSMFRAPSGIAPSKSIAEAAAHRSCQMHPVFENLPPRACLALLKRCNGHWKQVLDFLECLLLMQGHSAPASARSNVVATAGLSHMLIVNRKEELYITSRADYLCSLFKVYCDIAPEPQKHFETDLLTTDHQPHSSDLCELQTCCLRHRNQTCDQIISVIETQF